METLRMEGQKSGWASFAPAFLVAFAVLLLCWLAPQAAEAAVPSISYQAHSSNVGWGSSVKDGQTAGTTGRKLQMEALRINLQDGASSAVQYNVHLKNVGWQGWKSSGDVAGTTGQNRQVEAVKIKLTGGYESKYDVLYRVHVPDRGWLAWTKNGAAAGSEGLCLRVEAIQVKLAAKGTSVSGVAELVKPALIYRGHVQNAGWQSYVGEGSTAGTTGKAKRLEALMFSMKNFDGGNGISASAHVQDIGWQAFVGSTGVVGTTGKSKQIEAIRVRLEGDLGKFFDVYYRVHLRNVGWLGWAKNGEVAGSTGQNIPMEAIQVKVLNKTQSASFARGGAATYVKPAAPTPTQTTSKTSAAGYANPVVCASARWSAGKESGAQHDIQGVPVGTPVYAIAAGTITCQQKYNVKNNKLCSYGNVIYLTSSDGRTKATYAHLNGFAKCSPAITASMAYPCGVAKVGSKNVGTKTLGSYKVSKGELIGYVGTTGNSTGAHLHLEIRINGTRVNPPSYVNVR